MDPFVVIHALPTEPRAWFLGSAPSTFTRAGGRRSSTGSAGCCRSGAAGSASSQHVASARAVIANGGVFAQMPEGTVSGPPGRLGPFRAGWALIALRTGAPIVPFAMAGTEELYIGQRMASPDPARDLGRGAPRPGWDGVAPRGGSREELELAQRLSEALAARPRAGRRGAPAADRRPAGPAAPPARRLTWLLLRPGRLDRDGA